MRNKIYDCITFFNENLQVDLRFNILHEYVDKFVVCESKFDHKGNPKKLNFQLEKFEKFKNKIIYLVLENQFPDISDPWKTQAYQREYILKNLDEANPDDYIFFSDPDEIPRPEKLINFDLLQILSLYLKLFIKILLVPIRAQRDTLVRVCLIFTRLFQRNFAGNFAEHNS